MLSTCPHFVKTGAALAERGRHARSQRLVVLGVLGAHAWLLALLWDGNAAHQAETRPALVGVSVLPPAAAASPAVSSRHPGPGQAPAGRPPLAAPAEHQQVPPLAPAELKSRGTDRTLAPLASTTAEPSPKAMAAASSAAEAIPAASPVQSPGQVTGSGQKAATGQTAGAGASRIEPPDSSAGYLDNPRPAYPALSRRLGEQGQVLLRVWVEADGRPGKVELKLSSGFERLDRSAQQAVQRWRFVPGRRAGMPEAMWAEVPLQFTLE